jgi:hypothetical protein
VAQLSARAEPCTAVACMSIGFVSLSFSWFERLLSSISLHSVLAFDSLHIKLTQ